MEYDVPAFRSRVLSIQSHVVHGCVGNSAAAFPMQVNGVNVDTFNILSFSNHTGYPLSKGYRVTPDQFRSVAEGLSKNGFTGQYNYILSGYVGNAAVMEEIGVFVEHVLSGCTSELYSDSQITEDSGCISSEIHTRPVYICDPVCGDVGRLYVSQECVDVYRNRLLPLARMALPNGFEASVISGIDISSVETAIQAADWFHSVPKVPTVVIKSFSDKARDPSGKVIFMLVSEMSEGADGPKRQLIEVECVEGYFTGTGDAFGGLFLARYARAMDAAAKGMPHQGLGECVASAATATLGVLKRTKACRLSVTRESELKNAERGKGEIVDFDARELMLIHSIDILTSDIIGVKLTAL